MMLKTIKPLDTTVRRFFFIMGIYKKITFFMARKFKITEEQYRMAMNEGLKLQADPSTTGGDEAQAIKNTRDQAVASGVKLDNATIELPAKKKGFGESTIINKGEIKENHLRELKKNSKVYSLDEFIKKVTK